MSEKLAESKPVIVRITRIIDETPSIKTFEFDHEFEFSPGQFCMVWVPGSDEIPMGLSSGHSITVQKIGETTEALFNLKAGDKIGIKAPLGNGFTLPKTGKVLVIAGGVGSAPLRTIAAAGKCTVYISGSRTASEILFEKELSQKTQVMIATDDGTRGHHGFVTDLLAGLDLKSFDAVCVCGPEIMMRGILKILSDAGIADRGQFSLVRYMKCGIGICGSCCMDGKGLRICKDGPVFTGDELLQSDEFGKYSRDASGMRSDRK